MKYMVEYALLRDGLSHDQNLANLAALQKVFNKWAPEDGLTVHAMVDTLSGDGGYARRQSGAGAVW